MWNSLLFSCLRFVLQCIHHAFKSTLVYSCNAVSKIIPFDAFTSAYLAADVWNSSVFFGCCSDAGEQLLPLAAPVRLGAPTSLPAAQPVPGAGLLPVAAATAQRHRGVLPAAQHRNALLHLLLHGGTYDQCVCARSQHDCRRLRLLF